MFLFRPAAAIACSALILGVTPATAATIVLDKSFNAAEGSPSVYFVDNDFTLPLGFSNAVLTITNYYADDRGVVLLNGTIVDNGGVFGPGEGNLTLTPGGPNDPFTYTRGIGARDVVITSGFVAGLNSFRLLVNDTNFGIRGAPLPGGVNISATNIAASISYDIAGAIPEPSTWTMLILGFGAIGGVMRRRARTALVFA